MIKAIETRYKGYRFRSRLEARYAVFFDALGLNWEYEAEGFDLGDAGWYLPDFRVFQKVMGRNRDKPVYVEIKGSGSFLPSMIEKNVYMAGKIAPDCEDSMHNSWRELIADNEFLGNKHEFYSEANSFDPPVTFKHGFAYCGPHFSDNHGCYIAHERAFHQIDKCDFVFAWIDSNDAYGTLVEAGYAYASGKPVYMGFSQEVDSKDMWFAEKCSIKSGVFPSAIDAWESMVGASERSEPSGEEEKKISELSKHFGVAYLFSGDPLEGRSWAYRGGHAIRTGDRAIYSFVAGKGAIEKADAAAQKARSARFEHGEKP